MRRFTTILALIPLSLSAQFYVGEDALVHITEGAKLEVGGNLENTGAIQNLGTLTLYGDWTINNNFNGLMGELEFLGGGDQIVSPPELMISELTIAQGGRVSFPGDQITVTEQFDLQFGVVDVGEDTRFVLGPNASVTGGSNDSYFSGTLINQGSGIKKFPLGSNGVYAPITLLNVFGVDTEIASSFQTDLDFSPIPSDTLLGVSHMGLWEVELVNGGTDATGVEIEFNQIDLSDLRIRNNIRHLVNSPVIAFSYDLESAFGSLGVDQLLNSDSLTFGTIVGQYDVQPTLGEKVYFAVGLAPRIPNQGLLFIPEAFSPNATDPDNQSFKIFGENISEEDFSLTIYNKLGVRVFSTTSFSEANSRGWNGTNQATGAEEPSGIYYYSVRIKFESGQITERSGGFYLVK